MQDLNDLSPQKIHEQKLEIAATLFANKLLVREEPICLIYDRRDNSFAVMLDSEYGRLLEQRWNEYDSWSQVLAEIIFVASAKNVKEVIQSPDPSRREIVNRLVMGVLVGLPHLIRTARQIYTIARFDEEEQ